MIFRLIVRARDTDGRIATGYRGEVQFEAVEALDLLTAALLPEPYRFTADDGGEHRFNESLLAPVSLVAGSLQLLITDDTGLETRLTIPVQP